MCPYVYFVSPIRYFIRVCVSLYSVCGVCVAVYVYLFVSFSPVSASRR